MRRRAQHIVRVLGVCARCGFKPDLYDVARHHVPLAMPSGAPLPHELVVCRRCTTDLADAPTLMERAAAALDAGNPIDVMEFAQHWNADLGRVQRTARYFLGEERWTAVQATARADRAAQQAEEEVWRERQRQRAAMVLGDESDDGEEPY